MTGQTYLTLSDLPSAHSKNAIFDIIKRAKFINFETKISLASAPGDNFLGVLYRVKITGKKLSDKNESIHLMMKLSPPDPGMRTLIPINGFYTREFNAYTEILPCFDKLQDECNIPPEDRFQYAKCYKATCEDFKELIVMDDLATHGFKMYDRLKSFDCEHLTLVIKNLATFHALSFALKHKYPQLFDELSSHACQSVDFGDTFTKLIEHSMDLAIRKMEGDPCLEKLKSYRKDIYAQLSRLLEKELAAPYNVICHGDCWTNNFLFKYKDNKPVDMRTLDWQIIRHSSPITDIAYMIFTSTDEEVRRYHYSALLDLYYDTLRIRLLALGCDVEECYPYKIFQQHVKLVLPYGLIMSTFIIPIIMSDRDNAPDLMEILTHGWQVMEGSKLSEKCIKRMQGSVRDFFKFHALDY